MAEELTTGMLMRFLKGNMEEIKFGALSLKTTISGTHMVGDVITIGTTSEALALGDVATIGFVYIKNLDATNYVTVGVDATNQPIKVPPKQQIFTGWNGASVHVKANTASCVIQYKIVEA